jgi:hypothetical protein
MVMGHKLGTENCENSCSLSMLKFFCQSNVVIDYEQNLAIDELFQENVIFITNM